MRALLSRRRHTTLYTEQRAGTTVLAKVLNQEYPNPEHLACLHNELAISRALEGEGLRRGLEMTRLEGRHALILEYVEGHELSVMSVNDRAQLIDFLTVAERTARTLGALHEQRVIHRDLKPSNVLVTRDLQVKLIDFGLSSRLDVKATHLGNPRQLEGTLEYVAPEQTGRMNRTVDSRADLYSLGASLYEVLTGRPPFESQDPMELVYCHLTRSPVSAEVLNAAVPPMLAAVVMRLLRKNPEDRYQSAFGLAADLARMAAAARRGGALESFELGSEDASGRFALVEKLYGREAEVERLLVAFERARDGRVELVGVAGHSGSGKSALVAELHRPITERRGTFIAGKFDQLSRTTPYSALTQAFDELVRLLLTEDEETLAVWRARILSAVGELGRVLTSVAPRLELIIGAQPEVPALEGSAAQNRFHYVLRRFIRAVARQDHPLALFIDDLQWADLASMDVLEAILSDPECRHLLVIGAWRDNEVTSGHPLLDSLAGIERKGVALTRLQVGGLALKDVRAMLVDALHAPEEALEGLARLVYDKTSGNAFFVHQFLHLLADQGLLSYERGERRWRWELEKIAALQVTDNVVELLADKLRRLDGEAQQLLRIAACIGNRFDLETLAVLTERPAGELAVHLWPALSEGLLLPIGKGYRLVDASVELLGRSSAEYAFVHDRVQQAAYSLIAESERKPVHHRIGRLLLEGRPEGEQGALLFSIVHHLNLAADLVKGPQEALGLARLNLEAARRAHAASAFPQAIAYCEAGLRVLPADSWESAYELTLGLHHVAANAACISMDYERMQTLVDRVLARGHSGLDKALAYDALAMATMARKDLVGALELGRKALIELGVHFPASPKPPHIILALLRVRRALRGRVEELTELPPLEEPRIEAALGLMVRLLPAAFRAGSNLFPLFVFELVRLSVQHGNSSHSVFGYASYAIALCAVLKDYDTGYRFAKMALRLGETYPSVGHLFIFNNFVRHWKEPLRSCLEGLQTAHRVGLELGDVYQSTWSLCYQHLFSFFTGMRLPQVREQFEAHAEALRWDEGTDSMRRMMVQLITNLTEEVEAPHRLAGRHYDESSARRRFAELGDTTEIGHFHNNSLMLCVLLGATEEGLLHAQEVEKYVDALNPMPFLPLMNAYGALARLRGYRLNNRRTDLLRKAERSARLLRKWGRQAPVNYAPLAALVEAELSRSQGRRRQALEHYERAARAVEEHEAAPQTRGLVMELYGEFLLELRQGAIAQVFLQRAVHAYEEWGASALVRRLTESHPSLGARTLAKGERRASSFSSGTSGTAGDSELDLSTVMKASAAISAEIVMESLLERLVRIMAENAGAERGALLLAGARGLRVEAELDGEAVRLMQSSPPEHSEVVCDAIVKYVVRTGEPLVLADAQAHARFAHDTHVRRFKVRSVLCAPILHQGRLRGVVYLENNVAAGAFTPERLTLLELLSTQAGTSLENAQLYSRLEQKVAERTVEIERQRELIAKEKAKSEELLLNILPAETARELKEHGRAEARRYEGVSVLFADIEGFTRIAERLTPEELIRELDHCFRAFDEIMDRHGLEKIKTIGDAYMSAGGLPDPARGSPAAVVRAALEMQQFMQMRRASGEGAWRAHFRLRIGIHTGPVVAGVVGSRKFAYDIWGDTVNIAARIEQGGEGERVNVSGTTWELLQGQFEGSYRGRLPAKNKGEIDMYFVHRELPHAVLPEPGVVVSAAPGARASPPG